MTELNKSPSGFSGADVSKEQAAIRALVERVVTNYRSRTAPDRVQKASVAFNGGLILTLMLALSLLGYLVAELFRGYVADSSPYVPGLSYSQFSMLMIVELCLCFLAWFLVVTGDYPRSWIFQVVPMEQYWFFDEVDDDDLARLSCNPYIKRWLLDEMSGIHRLTYTRLHDRLERICNIPSHLEYSRIQAHKLSLINGTSAS
ncbi:hypothetical protein [Escherichia coli]|uniref:hypothetical protein n=1 Tax=Escherichia coli TaxID=562 RepID=UPI0021C7EC00|nr:hypothetical protein [Escherichia coli]MCU0009009.1 hypothetical protein [Escherichia coli]HDV3225394.1 hypothetical protein [Escherichia coli]